MPLEVPLRSVLLVAQLAREVPLLEVQLGVECSVCHHKFACASACRMHVSTVVSAGCSGESLSAYAPHLFVSDLLCVCYVLLCVPALQHDKERNFPCQQCGHKAGSSNDLKKHVKTVVSRSVCVTHLLLSDVLCDTAGVRV